MISLFLNFLIMFFIIIGILCTGSFCMLIILMVLDSISFEIQDKHGNKAKYYRESGYQNHINQRRKSKLSSVERKKGKWEKIAINPDAYDIAGVKTWAIQMRCNQCGFRTFAIEGHFAQYNFCPRCGSQNEVVEDVMLHTYKEGEE